MTLPLHIAVLSDRGIVAVLGPDAGTLLQGLITNDMSALDRQPALAAALLSPQGKILFDFIVMKSADGYLLDVARAKAGELAKRLTLYRLRAKVEITDDSERHAVLAIWGEDGGAVPAGAVADPRLPALGWRLVLPATAPPPVGSQLAAASAEAYHAHRIGQGVPEGGRDFAFGDAYPHEALLDQLNGVSFTKGCYVGQEIVSRMEHRGTARKRIVPVVAAAALPASGTEITGGELPIGTLGSTAGRRGLASLRLDRAAECESQGLPLTAAGLPLKIELPTWAKFHLPVPEAHG